MWLNTRNMVLFAALLLLLVWSGRAVQFNLAELYESLGRISEIAERWWPPDWSKLQNALNQTFLTLQIAFVGSFVALIIVLPLSFFAAKNIAPSSIVYHLIRGLFSFLRSIPDIVIGLILVMMIGLGTFPAVMAILLHNIGVLGKLISELVEAADKGPQEVVRSLGLGRTAVAFYGILPQIFPNVLSHYFYRFEVAIRTSLILGFIGGGGIGQLLFNSYRIFDYASVTMYVICIMILVILVDIIGSFVRNRII